MRKLAVASLVIAASVVASALQPGVGRAIPASIWVLNLNIVNASSAAGSCAVPHDCDPTSATDRAVLQSSFGQLQAAGKGMVQQEPAGFMGTPQGGSVYIVASTDGSLTAALLNGRGLHCSPACDAVTGTSPSPTDHMIAYRILDTGSFHAGDMFVATFTQNGVSLDTMTMTIVGPPPAVAKQFPDGPGGIIDVFAGGGAGDGGPATSAPIIAAAGIAVRGSSIYVADQGNCRVREITSGTITSVAGHDSGAIPPCPDAGDGGPATDANVEPVDMAFDGAGNMYIAELNNCYVREVSLSGMITRVAGSCGGQGLAIDHSGNLLIAMPCTVARLSAGVLTTVVGNGTCTYGGDGGQAVNAGIQPTRLAVDATGNLYISDVAGCRIRMVTLTAATPMISTIAGNGTCGTSVDPGPALSAQFDGPAGIAVGGTTLYVADTRNCKIRAVDLSAVPATISTFAGTGTCGISADPGPATSAQLNLSPGGGMFMPFGSKAPSGLAVDGSGNLIIADSKNCLIRKVSSGTISTIAGNGSCTNFEGGDGGLAASAGVRGPEGVAVDGAGNAYIADNQSCTIRRVYKGVISTVAGTGTCGSTSDPGVATAAQFQLPTGVAVDDAGNVYLADTGNCRIRKVDFTASPAAISTIAGTGTCGVTSDPGPALSAQLNAPLGVAAHGSDVYFADFSNCLVRKVSGGTISTVAGTGTCALDLTNGPATSIPFLGPVGIFVDAAGNVFVTDSSACVVRKISGGTSTIVAGSGYGAPGFCNSSSLGDGGAATAASLYIPSGVVADASGDLYVLDSGHCQVRKVSNGAIHAFAGAYAGPSGSYCGYAGNGGPALPSALFEPWGIAIDAVGNIYVSDWGDDHVRIIYSPDSDGDGCRDVSEAGLGLSVQNAWDFYSVPAPALFAAPYPATESHDGIVGAADAQAVFAYFKKNAKTGSLEYEQDLNNNGVKDGIEYDRSFISAGHSGPPDGVIGAADAQLAFAQFKMKYVC